MSNGNNQGSFGNFPDPFAKAKEKGEKEYGLKYAKAIEKQWGSADDSSSLFAKRLKEFDRNRDYGNGTQDTSIYKQILNSLDPNNGDGTLLNIDWSPVPIIPKFVRVVVNRILSRKPYPSVEALDPVSIAERDKKRASIEVAIENKEKYQGAKKLGLNMEVDPDTLPDSTEEAEIFMDSNLKTNAEIAAQMGAALTLDWTDFEEKVYRRAVTDLVTVGLAVSKRENDPNYGINVKYVDPMYFLHSYTEDPTMSDLVYGAHINRISIQELKRVAGDDLTETQYKDLARGVQGKEYNNSSSLNSQSSQSSTGRTSYGYDDYLIDVLEFEFISVDTVIYENKTSQYGNEGFYRKNEDYVPPNESVYDRDPHQMQNQTLYGGCYVLGTEILYGYKQKNNTPKNIHDISRTKLSYSVTCVNIRRMMPKSMVGSVTGFADQLQLTHLKIQQALAKAKPDGLIVDIEGLENVQLGRGGELQPLDIQDIYEQTGIFYYRSKNPEGGFQNPPVRAIENQIRNINQYIALYNHYLTMVRDATGINEVMDATTPKGDALVGVQQQALAAGNNALYDITNASLVFYRKVCSDIVKCLQIIPIDSVLFRVYEKAIGQYNMEILTSFAELPMYNFGVQVIKEMSDEDRMFLEQNMQVSLAQKELDLEDVMAIRQLKDIDQAQRLLVVRRKRRMAMLQKQQQENMQAQSQAQSQAAQEAAQMKMQEVQAQAQVDIQKIQVKGQVEVQVAAALHEMKKELEMIKAQAVLGIKTDDQEFKQKIEVLKEDRKDSRVGKQAVEQSKLISQRKGTRTELPEPSEGLDSAVNQMISDAKLS